MIPVGYMYKDVAVIPKWLKTEMVDDIYSVSSCVSDDFCDYISYWRHNGYWFFDSPEIMKEIALEQGISLNRMKLFYYDVYEEQWDDEDGWMEFFPEPSLETNVVIPLVKEAKGYDIVTYSAQTNCECSPLSCNHMAEELIVNRHCLIDSFEKAKELVELNTFRDCEPGPLRIHTVYEPKVA